MMAMMSGIKVPSSIQGRIEMLENEAERILRRTRPNAETR